MTYEIELKAWVEDPELTGERLSRLARFTDTFYRDDTYWFPPEGFTAGAEGLPASGIRIRKEQLQPAQGEETHSVWVTYKSKEVREGIEVNREHEFLVSGRDGGDSAFEELLRRLNFAPGAAKVKRGRAWRSGDIRAELTLVEGLGWFVEMEILVDRDDPETRENARKQLLELLDKTGIRRDKIEERYYTELIACAGRNHGTSGI
ncbi:MAG: class IV adenylate cyclase [Treponema sp.]|jgi:adenylate cyclase class 2|nr:class IV adenylate cyclase [Treponema sp.]